MNIAKISGLVSVGALALASATAAAQTPQGADTAAATGAQQNGLVDIIVTANKRSERLQDVPIAVTAISSATLGQANVAIQSDLPKITPGLTINSGSSFVAPYLRGVGTQYANPGLESEIGIYVDDLYIRVPQASLLNLVDLERVEVLKGPQGTLYGRNTTGGAIRFITADPGKNFSANATVAYGNHNRFLIGGTVNIPVAENLYGRFSIQHDQRDGYVHNVVPGGKDLENRNVEVYRGKLLWEPADRLTIKLSGNYTRKRDTESGTLSLSGARSLAPYRTAAVLGAVPVTGFYQTSQNGHDPYDIRDANLSLRIDYDLDSVVLSSITGYVYSKYSSGGVGSAVGGDIDSSEFPLLNFTQSPVIDKIYSQEFQAVSSGSGPFKYSAGVYAMHETTREVYAVSGSFISTTGSFLLGHAGVITDSIAPYAEGTYSFGKVAITAGGRYTLERKKEEAGAVGLSTVYDINSPAYTVFNPILPAEVNFKKFTPKITLSYKPFPGLLLYGTYSVGFKSGGFNNPFTGFTGQPNQTEPEELKNLELGAKYSSSTLRFNVSAFHYDFTNIVVQSQDPVSGTNVARNAASSRIYGIDGDFSWKPSRELEIAGGGSYLNSKFKRYTGTVTLPVNDITPGCHLPPLASIPAAQVPQYLACSGGADVVRVFDGNRLPYSPKFSGFFRATYTQDVGDMGSVAITGIANYSSRYFVYADEGLAYKARTLLSANVTWQINDHYSVAIYGENLANKKYYSNIVQSATGGWASPAAPRMVYGQLSVKF